MTASPEVKPTENENSTYDMLDVLVLIAENWLVLFVLPVFLAVIGYFGVGMLERPWVAGLNVPAVSTALGDPAVMEFVAKNTDGTSGFSVARSGTYFYLQAASASDEEASSAVQKAAATLIELETAAVDAEVGLIDERLKNLNTIVSRSQASTSSAETAMVYTLAYAMAGVTLQIDNLTAQRAATLQERSLLTATDTVLLSQQGRSPVTIALAIAILSGILIAMLLLARFMWSAVAKNPKNATRIERIRSAIVLKRRA